MTTTLLHGGTVYSPADPFATAMLLVDAEVAWVGQDGAAQAHADGVDAVVDLDGRLVTPAFVDAHVHTTETGLAMTGLDLRAVASVAEALDLVAAAAAAAPGRPVLGSGWDADDWLDRRPPTLAELDRAAPGTPVYLARVDVHSAVVSGALVDLAAGIRDADGWSADGFLRRDAHHRARRASRDALTPGHRRDLQRATLRRAGELGIGQLHEISAPHIAGPDDLRDLLALAAGEPLPQVVPYWGALHDVDTARELGAVGAAGDLCIDGSLGSRTARLSQDYADAPGERGSRYVDLTEATAHVVACTRAGLQAGFHVIGDEAVDLGVAALVGAAEQCGADAVRAARHRLEHVEMCRLEHADTLARLGVTASVQPLFDALWGGEDGMYTRRLGPDRARGMNPWAALRKAGVRLALGSDSPVTDLGPWAAVRAASAHRTPASSLSVRGAFTAHTRGGWVAAGLDDGGVLAPGQRASYAVWDVEGDLVVRAPDDRVAAWSTDPRSGVPGLPDLSPGVPLPVCRRTVVHGVTVHDTLGT